MKKVMVLLVFILMLSVLTGCGVANGTGGEYSFKAIILQIDGNTVTVEPLEGEDILRSGDRINFNKSELDDIGATVGTAVNIVYVGGVRESYPGQVTAISWSLLEPPNATAMTYATYEPTTPFGIGDGALLDGILRQRNDCIVVEIKDGSEADGSEVLPIFPANVTVWEEAKNALILNGTEYLLGSQISFGGGYASNINDDYTIPESYSRPAEVFIVTAISWSLVEASNTTTTPYATYEPTAPFGTGDGALLDGILRQRNGCIVVEIKDGSEADGSEVLPIFPATVTAWDEAKNSLILNGTEYLLGSQVSFGGGYASNINDDYTIPESYGRPAEAFIVSNHGL